MSFLPPLLALALCAPALTAATSPSPAFPSVGFADLPWDAGARDVRAPVLNGSVPSWLDGSTLYRNGPGRYASNASHWFDGLAMLFAWRVRDGGEVYCSYEWVVSGTFNDSAPGGHAGVPGSVNTAVTIRSVDGAMLSNTGYLDSNSFDPDTLATLEAPFAYNDSLAPGPAPSHGQSERATGRFVHFLADFLSKPPGYALYRVRPGSRVREVFARVPANPAVGLPMFMHSFALTPSYAVVIEQPCTYGPLGWSSFVWLDTLPVTWHVVERSTGRVAANFTTTPPFFFFHTINSFENAAGDVVVDLVPYRNASILDALYVSQLRQHPHRAAAIGAAAVPTRYVLPVATGGRSAGGEVAGSPLAAVGVELPKVSPLVEGAEYRYAYGVGWARGADSVFMDSLVKVDVSGGGGGLVWTGGDLYPGEPIFAPRPQSGGAPALHAPAGAEDDGVLLSVVLDAAAGSSFLLVLDAGNFRELARAGAGRVEPFGFHGYYYRAVDGDRDAQAVRSTS